ncbi:GhoT/OrtT family toxin [Edwardsiella piscicida]|nr:GhoT/OrtT family toxin [Edwardsiella piscicida]EKS7779293.1 GhoT/OrtT family toxin [Edwardsiella piscicida]EKS7782713.1 GhoT/OrtT family toxin [Edwardsiella piscicida]EKS7794466.1 GhoT/OrtT family toxin [Edwardsiella piscicida]EKS7811703.1 GhoT/OrtT family toxin [Edwardsiella piscicida]
MWSFIKTAYCVGVLFCAFVTFFATKDPSIKIRLLSAVMVGLTWPMSFPLVVVFWLFM